VGVPIPVHLAVHVLGLAVAAGLVAAALLQRREATGRYAMAVGAALLAASHLLLGGLWADPAGAVLLVRTAGYAAVAVGVAGRLTGGLAVVAVLPPVLHIATGVAGLAAAVASARGVLGRGRTILPLAAGLALWAAGDLLTVASPPASAVASLAGSVAVGVWVLERAGARSLTGRIAGAFVAVLLVLTVGLASASGLVFSADLRTEQVERLAAVASAQAADLAEAAPVSSRGPRPSSRAASSPRSSRTRRVRVSSTGVQRRSPSCRASISRCSSPVTGVSSVRRRRASRWHVPTRLRWPGTS
jgi:hypothetical protein